MLFRSDGYIIITKFKKATKEKEKKSKEREIMTKISDASMKRRTATMASTIVIFAVVLCASAAGSVSAQQVLRRRPQLMVQVSQLEALVQHRLDIRPSLVQG